MLRVKKYRSWLCNRNWAKRRNLPSQTHRGVVNALEKKIAADKYLQADAQTYYPVFAEHMFQMNNGYPRHHKAPYRQTCHRNPPPRGYFGMNTTHRATRRSDNIGYYRQPARSYHRYQDNLIKYPGHFWHDWNNKRCTPCKEYRYMTNSHASESLPPAKTEFVVTQAKMTGPSWTQSQTTTPSQTLTTQSAIAQSSSASVPRPGMAVVTQSVAQPKISSPKMTHSSMQADISAQHKLGQCSIAESSMQSHTTAAAKCTMTQPGIEQTFVIPPHSPQRKLQQPSSQGLEIDQSSVHSQSQCIDSQCRIVECSRGESNAVQSPMWIQPTVKQFRMALPTGAKPSSTNHLMTHSPMPPLRVPLPKAVQPNIEYPKMAQTGVLLRPPTSPSIQTAYSLAQSGRAKFPWTQPSPQLHSMPQCPGSPASLYSSHTSQRSIPLFPASQHSTSQIPPSQHSISQNVTSQSLPHPYVTPSGFERPWSREHYPVSKSYDQQNQGKDTTTLNDKHKNKITTSTSELNSKIQRNQLHTKLKDDENKQDKGDLEDNSTPFETTKLNCFAGGHKIEVKENNNINNNESCLKTDSILKSEYNQHTSRSTYSPDIEESSYVESESSSCDEPEAEDELDTKDAQQLLMSMANRRLKISRLLEEQKRLMANLHVVKSAPIIP